MEEEEEEDDPADEDGAPKVTCMDTLHGFVETFPIMVTLITCIIVCTCILCSSLVSPVAFFPRFGFV